MRRNCTVGSSNPTSSGPTPCTGLSGSKVRTGWGDSPSTRRRLRTRRTRAPLLAAITITQASSWTSIVARTPDEVRYSSVAVPAAATSNAKVAPNAGRPVASTPPLLSTHPRSNGTARCTVPAGTSADAASVASAPTMIGAPPLRSAWASDAAPAVRLTSAAVAVSTLRTGTHARFSYTTKLGGLYTGARSSWSPRASMRPSGGGSGSAGLDTPPSTNGTTTYLTANGASNLPARVVEPVAIASSAAATSSSPSRSEVANASATVSRRPDDTAQPIPLR